MKSIGFYTRNIIGAFWNWWLADLYYLRKEVDRIEDLGPSREEGGR